MRVQITDDAEADLEEIADILPRIILGAR